MSSHHPAALWVQAGLRIPTSAGVSRATSTSISSAPWQDDARLKHSPESREHRATRRCWCREGAGSAQGSWRWAGGRAAGPPWSRLLQMAKAIRAALAHTEP